MYLPITSYAIPTSTTLTRSYFFPRPVRQLATPLTLTIGTEREGIKVSVGMMVAMPVAFKARVGKTVSVKSTVGRGVDVDACAVRVLTVIVSGSSMLKTVEGIIGAGAGQAGRLKLPTC